MMSFILSAFKGAIYKQFETEVSFLNVIQIPPYDFLRAIFIIQNTFYFYPSNTIFFIFITKPNFVDRFLLPTEI